MTTTAPTVQEELAELRSELQLLKDKNGVRHGKA